MDLKIGSVYSFDTVAPALLGTRRERVRLASVMNYDYARRHDALDLKHRQLYPLLPENTPDAPETFVYYLFETESKESFIMAQPWIVESTIQEINSINILVRIYDGTMEDIPSIRDALNAVGLTDFTINHTGA
jgi:hypothetical protein